MQLRKTIVNVVLLGTFVWSGVCGAQQAESPDDYFGTLYSTLCMLDQANVEVLRTELNRRKLPALSPENAFNFLGQAGDVWPIPYHGNFGNFMLGLPAEDNACLIYARLANVPQIERIFLALVKNAPAGSVATKVVDEWAQAAGEAKVHTLAYTWAIPNARSKTLFMLKTVASKDAALQAAASTSIVTQP
jgi:hypothetical protein